MKILLDSCVWGKARHELEMAGHDVAWSGDWPGDPGDEEILAIANDQGRLLVTLDKDFGELAVRRGRSHCGILRLVGISAHQQAAVCREVLARQEAELTSAQSSRRRRAGCEFACPNRL